MKKLFIAFAAVALVAAFATTTVAGDWNFYGSARVSWWSIDAERPPAVAGQPNIDERNSRFQLQNNTRLGARIKGGKVYGRFELGINPDNDAQSPAITGANAQANGAGPGVYTRLLFGAWNFGSGTLLVGKDYTPEYLGISTANLATGSDSVMIGRGVPYGGRRAQLRLEFGGFHFAVVDNTGASTLNSPAAAFTKVTIPKLAAKYTHKFDPISFTLAGSYQKYDVKQTGVSDLSVDSWYLGLRATAKFGAFGIKGVIYGAQNANEHGLSGGGVDGAVVVNGGTPNARIVDNDTLGYCITGTFKLNDMFMFEAGWGYVKAEQDDSNMNNLGVNDSGALGKDDRTAYYLNSTITLAPGVFIVPEIGVDDLKNSAANVDEGDNQYIGAKFQINF